MCGRYATTRSSAELGTLFEALDETDGSLVADYNVAPTDPVPVIRMSTRRSARVLCAARWGLVPSWASDPRGGARMINARAETVATTPAYAKPFASRRCLVPADGWYEWARRPGGKQAYYLTVDGGPLAFGGLWSAWGPEPLITCSIVTVAARGDLALVHARMPLVLPPSRWAAWLTGPASDGLLAPAPEEYLAGLEIRPVGPAVGDVRNDGPSLTSPVPAAPLGAQPDGPVELTLF